MEDVCCEVTRRARSTNTARDQETSPTKKMTTMYTSVCAGISSICAERIFSSRLTVMETFSPIAEPLARNSIAAHRGKGRLFHVRISSPRCNSGQEDDCRISVTMMRCCSSSALKGTAARSRREGRWRAQRRRKARSIVNKKPLWRGSRFISTRAGLWKTRLTVSRYDLYG